MHIQFHNSSQNRNITFKNFQNKNKTPKYSKFLQKDVFEKSNKTTKTSPTFQGPNRNGLKFLCDVGIREIDEKFNIKKPKLTQTQKTVIEQFLEICFYGYKDFFNGSAKKPSNGNIFGNCYDLSAIGYEHFSKNPLITQDFDVIVCKGFLPYNENGKIKHFMIGLVPKKQKFDPKNLPESLIIVDPSLNFVRYNIYDKTLLVPNATEKIELLRTPNGKIITNLPIMGPILGIIGYTKDFLKNYLITDLDDFLFMDFNEMSKSFLFYRINSKNKYKTHVPISALDINVDVLRLLKNKIIESIYFANYNS